jgi:large conductance mechanosensitive channel
MKKFLNEFKDFISKGNVFDLAIGIIIGSAFGKIISSFVNDILMPFISLLLGNVNVADLKVVLKGASDNTAELSIKYGMFIQTFIDFIIIAFVLFMMIRFITKLKKKELEKPSVPPAPSNEEILLTEIRDLLKK